jgi:exopolysaccharide biosynthesis polyprenyl glycosylphosphotransferase
MNAAERLALSQGTMFYEEIMGFVDDRTLEILERRRTTATVRRRGWLIRRMLAVADVVGLIGAFALTEAIFGYRESTGPGAYVAGPEELVIFLATLPVWIVLAKLYGLYHRDEEHAHHSTSDEFIGVFHLVTVGAWLLLAGTWAMRIDSPPVPKLACLWALAVVAIVSCRSIARSYSRTRLTYLQNTLIVGAGDVGQLIAQKLLQHPEYGINLVGFVDAMPRELRQGSRHLALLGPPRRLPAIIRLFDVERVIVAFSSESHEDVLDLIRTVRDLDVQIDVVPRMFEVISPAFDIHTIEGIPLVALPPTRLSRSSRLLKRAADLSCALAGLVLLAPVLLLIAIVIKRDSPGPVFFRQTRMGAGDETFQIVKFRTMVADAEERKAELAHLNKHGLGGGDPRMFKASGDPRVTRIGRFLRKYSLDELPQLYNVVRGDMSLVGPRPLILDEDQYVRDWARKRLDLKPGVTGLWQVLGRTDIPFTEMVKLDYLYVTTWSLWNDFGLLVKTIPIAFRGERAAH